MKVSIVVPLYNEERTIINILSKIQDEIKKVNEFNFEVGISYFGRSHEEGKKLGFKDAVSAFISIIKYSF